MRVAYLSFSDPTDITAWSGLVHYMFKCLQDQGFEVDPIICPRPSAFAVLSYPKRLFFNRILGGQLGAYLPNREPLPLRWAASRVSRKLEEYDLVFSPGALPVAYLRTKVPVVTWTDSTFACMSRSAYFKRLSTTTIRAGDAIERRALGRTHLAVYASDWAATSAVRDYGLSPSKVAVIPFGANLDSPPTTDSVTRSILERSRRPLKLLFVGVDWKRKGGPMAVDVGRQLNAQGIPSTLTVVGCRPALNEPFVNSIGFLSKRRPEAIAQLRKLFSESHWMVMPSEAEAFGVVYAEANCFGVPCIATTVDGVPSAVREGINGKTFRPGATPAEIADFIASRDRTPESYTAIAARARCEYETRLNWMTSGARLKELIYHTVRSNRP